MEKNWEDQKPELNSTKNEPLLTIRELALELKIKKSWIYDKSRQKGDNTIPLIRVGKYLRFRRSEVLDWLTNKHEAE